MVRHISSIAEIVDDVDAAVAFYRDVLGLAVQYEAGSDYATAEVPGVLHFGIWSRKAAAEATFGEAEAADRISLGFTVGFEVDAVDASSQEIKARGWTVVQSPKQEPWGQTTSRFFSPSGALCEVAETPDARRITQNVQAQAETD